MLLCSLEVERHQTNSGNLHAQQVWSLQSDFSALDSCWMWKLGWMIARWSWSTSCVVCADDTPWYPVLLTLITVRYCDIYTLAEEQTQKLHLEFKVCCMRLPVVKKWTHHKDASMVNLLSWIIHLARVFSYIFVSLASLTFFRSETFTLTNFTQKFLNERQRKRQTWHLCAKVLTTSTHFPTRQFFAKIAQNFAIL